MTLGAVTTSASPLWYFARATGIVSLLLLTVTVVLGIVTTVRLSTPRWPRFAIEYVHRNVTLVVLALLVLHVAAVVLDGFAPIGWAAAFVPFSSPYRPIWLGLGAVAFDLLLAVAVTSWLRHRVGFRVWRFFHWSAYASWGVAVLHGLGTGSDTKRGWALLVDAACVLVVVLAVWWRLAVGWEQQTRVRVAALAATFVAPLALAGWLRVGPLAPGWARRSGTPASVLARSSGTQPAPATQPTSSPSVAPSSGGSDGGGGE